MNTQSQKIAIITGANNGIGFETTLGMVRAGYHVVMACRSMDKADAARAKLIQAVPGASLDVIRLDLGDFASVQAFAAEFRERYAHLDVLINNAGILLYSHRTNADGVELQFVTNHLGHFLLTALLIDLMPDSAASRIVSLSSIAHKGATIQFDNLGREGEGEAAYAQSKLACLLFGDELDRRLRRAGRELISLSVHPGGSDSGLFTDMAADQRDAMKAQVEHLLHSNADAAKSSLYAALSPDAAGGDYYGPTGLHEMAGDVGRAMRDPITDDRALAAQLWRVSEEMTGQTFAV